MRGIVLDVFAHVLEMNFIANHAVEILRLPDDALAIESLIDFFCREALPRMEDVLQLVIGRKLQQDMHVVWHDNETVQGVAIPIKMIEGVTDNFGDLWVA